MTHSCYRLAEIEVDLLRRRVTRDGIELDLAPKQFDLLAALVRRNGVVATRSELFEEVWPRIIVSDQNLTQTVFALRRHLADEGGRIIRNVPRRGYAIGVDVVPIPAIGEPATARSGESGIAGERGAPHGVDAGASVPAGSTQEPEKHRGGAEGAAAPATTPGPALVESRTAMDPPADAGSLSAVVVGQGGNASIATGAAPQTWARQWRLALATLGAIVLAGVGLTLLRPAVQVLPRLAIWGAPGSPEQEGDDISLLAVDSLANSLAPGNGVRVVDRRDFQSRFTDLGLPRTGGDTNDALNAARVSGIDLLLVVGARQDTAGMVSGTLELLTVANGKRLGTARIDGENGVEEWLLDARDFSRESLGLIDDSSTPAPRILGKPSAVQAFAAALRAADRGDLAAADAAFSRAIADDPAFALAHLERANVLAAMGRAEDATLALQAAMGHAEALTMAMRLEIEARLAIAKGEDAAGREILGSLVAICPECTQIGITLAWEYASAGRLDAALALLERIDGFAVTDRQRAQWAAARANLTANMGLFRRALPDADKAVAFAERAASPVLVVQARLARADILTFLGRIAESRADLDQSLAMLRESRLSGHERRWRFAKAVNSDASGDYETAIEMLTAIIESQSRTAPIARSTVAARCTRVKSALSIGRIEDAAADVMELRTLDQDPRLAFIRPCRMIAEGALAFWRRDYAEARARLADALAASRGAAQQSEEQSTRLLLASLEFREGDYASALAQADEVASSATRSGETIMASQAYGIAALAAHALGDESALGGACKGLRGLAGGSSHADVLLQAAVCDVLEWQGPDPLEALGNALAGAASAGLTWGVDSVAVALHAAVAQQDSAILPEDLSRLHGLAVRRGDTFAQDLVDAASIEAGPPDDRITSMAIAARLRSAPEPLVRSWLSGPPASN